MVGAGWSQYFIPLTTTLPLILEESSTFRFTIDAGHAITSLDFRAQALSNDEKMSFKNDFHSLIALFARGTSLAVVDSFAKWNRECNFSKGSDFSNNSALITFGSYFYSPQIIPMQFARTLNSQLVFARSADASLDTRSRRVIRSRLANSNNK